MSFFAKGSKLFQDMVSQLQTTGTADLCECSMKGTADTESDVMMFTFGF